MKNEMSKIKKLTQTIRNCAECELDYGTIRTLKMIDDEDDKFEAKISRSNEKSGLKLALDIISTEQRYNMCYEWMEETKNGEYIKIESIKRKIIKELKKEGNK